MSEPRAIKNFRVHRETWIRVRLFRTGADNDLEDTINRALDLAELQLCRKCTRVPCEDHKKKGPT